MDKKFPAVLAPALDATLLFETTAFSNPPREIFLACVACFGTLPPPPGGCAQSPCCAPHAPLLILSDLPMTKFLLLPARAPLRARSAQPRLGSRNVPKWRDPPTGHPTDGSDLSHK